MYAIQPKLDCPHVSIAVSSRQVTLPERLQVDCESCADGSENWLCLSCHKTFCSRYVKGHMAEHFAEHPMHCIAASCSDLSVHCYECDAYIADPRLQHALDAMRGAKFPCSDTKHGVVPASSNVSDCVRDVEREESDDDTPGLTQMLMKMMGISVGSSPADSTGITFVDLSKGLIDGRFRNIVFLVGAGISTAAGIPDFRSPGTGLYDNLRRFNLPHPTAVFSIDYFRENPLPFYLLSRDLMPSQDLIVPKAHQFMKICTDRGLVRRIYSQNIDDLERMAGIPDEILIQAHGAFRDCLCIDCGSHISIEQFKEKLHSDKLERELVLCTKCGGLIKPAIVFFGESLPEQFFQSVEADMDACDLMIIMGTSLTVAPVCRLPHMLDRRVPRVVINRDRLASVNDEDRDLLLLGDLEEQVASLISACPDVIKYIRNDFVRNARR